MHLLINFRFLALGFLLISNPGHLFAQEDINFSAKIVDSKTDTITSSHLKGNYIFRNAKTGQYLASDSSNVVSLGRPSFEKDRIWELKSSSRGYYSISQATLGRGSITARRGNDKIDLEEGEIDGTKEWQILQIDSVTFKFLNKDNSKGFITAVDNNLQSSTNDTDLASQWQLINTKTFAFEKEYYLRNVATGNFLDSDKDGIITQHPEKRGESSIWKFRDTGDGFIMIDNIASDRGPILATNTSGDRVSYGEETSSAISNVKWKLMYLHYNRLQFLNENVTIGYLTADGNDSIITYTEYRAKESSWELIPADTFDFTENYLLRNVKSGRYLNAADDLSIKQQVSKDSDGTEWTIKSATDGYYIFDNVKENIGPLSATPYHSDMQVLEERYNTWNFMNREWQVIHIKDNRYKFLSKDFNRGFMTGIEFDRVQNLPDETDDGVLWELIKKNENTNTEITIYPNPAINDFTINFGIENIQKVLIYTITGRLIFEKAITISQSEVLITQSMRSGTYMIQLLNNLGETTTHRLIML